jgi:ATP-dependent exoDNAse (exonuclease V) alpha subunit
MFDRIAHRAPTAELADVHRTSDPAARKAWAALRAGEPESAMAHYQARGQLFFNDTRDEAGEAAVQRWAELTETRDVREVALIADASNVEIDRLNARAQHLRIDRGELRGAEVPLPHQHYGLYEGDLITFTAQHRIPGHARVENGTRGQVTRTHDRGLTVLLDGSKREVTLAGQDLERLRLAYAQHVYRQQGATVERSVVVTGGWQISKESAYVQASRAREGTEWFLARDELGLEGQDDRRVRNLADKMRNSRAHTPSLAHPELPDPEWGHGFKPTLAPSRSRLPGLVRTIHRITQPDRTADRGR